jgi:hypothetical protein
MLSATPLGATVSLTNKLQLRGVEGHKGRPRVQFIPNLQSKMEVSGNLQAEATYTSDGEKEGAETKPMVRRRAGH